MWDLYEKFVIKLRNCLSFVKKNPINEFSISVHFFVLFNVFTPIGKRVRSQIELVGC